MIKKHVFYVTGLIAFLSFSSCRTYNCGEAPGLRISAVGLTLADIDTIVLRKFIKGSGFTKMIDSVSISNHYAIVHDTATAGAFYSNDLLYSNFDYEIYLPAINKQTRITDMYEPQQKMKKSLFSTTKEYCSNIVQSYMQDGTSISTNGYYNQVFIHR